MQNAKWQLICSVPGFSNAFITVKKKKEFLVSALQTKLVNQFSSSNKQKKKPPTVIKLNIFCWFATAPKELLVFFL